MRPTGKLLWLNESVIAIDPGQEALWAMKKRQKEKMAADIEGA